MTTAADRTENRPVPNSSESDIALDRSARNTLLTAPAHLLFEIVAPVRHSDKNSEVVCRSANLALEKGETIK